MEKKRSYYNLEETLRQAAERFSEVDPAEAAQNAGATYNPDKQTITVTFIGDEFWVEHPSGKVTGADGEETSLYLAIIILHYLVTATGTPLTGNWIAFRHLPGGDIYIEPFQNRAVKPFLKNFGDNPEEFKKAALSLGGREIKQSGISMVIYVLPRVPICFTIWPGDDELPASATILFDEAASSYLPTEDYAHIPAIVNGAMKGRL
jgi:hypothetical protein